MKGKITDEDLNRILAQPAQLADFGFTEKVKARLSLSEPYRTNVFAVVAVFCGLIALAAGSPSLLIDTTLVPGLSWDNIGMRLIQLLPVQESAALQLISNSSFFGSITTILLVVTIVKKLSEE